MAYTCDPEAGRAGPQRQPGIQKEKALLKDKFSHRFTEQRHRTPRLADMCSAATHTRYTQAPWLSHQRPPHTYTLERESVFLSSLKPSIPLSELT